jgi:hypothetical protein
MVWATSSPRSHSSALISASNSCSSASTPGPAGIPQRSHSRATRHRRPWQTSRSSSLLFLVVEIDGDRLLESRIPTRAHLQADPSPPLASQINTHRVGRMASRQRPRWGTGPAPTHRDVAALTWVAEQYAVRADTLGLLLGRLSPETPQTIHRWPFAPGQWAELPTLAEATVRYHLCRWLRAGWVRPQRALGRTWIVPTRRGLDLTGSGYRPWSLVPSQLPACRRGGPSGHRDGQPPGRMVLRASPDPAARPAPGSLVATRRRPGRGRRRRQRRPTPAHHRSRTHRQASGQAAAGVRAPLPR